MVFNPAFFGATWSTVTSSSFFAGTPATQTGSLALTTGARTVTIPAGNPAYFMAVAQIFGTNMGAVGTFGWNGALVVSNCALSTYDGANSSNGSTINGTNPNTDSLRYVFGFRVIDTTLPATITLPTISTTSGSFGSSSLTVTTIA